MSRSGREYLRDKQRLQPQRYTQRPIGDSSLLTQMHRYKASAACTTISQQQRSDGQMLQPSQDGLLAAAGGNSVCGAPQWSDAIVQTKCCEQEAAGGVAAGLTGYFWQGAPLRALGIPGPVVYEEPRCCS